MAFDLQNFYKSTLLLDWTIGTGTFYVTTKPTVSTGWLVISPNNTTLREIIRYTSTGTDSNGDYVVVSVRGVGGTTEQIHSVGEPIRMNITAEYWDAMNDDIAAIVASGVSNANTTTMGGVEIATSAEMIAGTDIGGTGASVVPTPSVINTQIDAKITAKAVDIQVFTANGTWTKPAGAKSVHVVAVGAGGGGGRPQNDTLGGGGGGGGGGGKVFDTFPASILGSTETITVSSSGGAGATTSGSEGNSGTNSTFGIWLKAGGGQGGVTSGTNVAKSGGIGFGTGSIGGNGSAGVNSVLGGAGGGGSTGNPSYAGGDGNRFGAAGGASGAGAGNIDGAGGGSVSTRGTTLSGGGGGTVGVNASNGSGSSTNEANTGAGGGGGYGNASGNGTNGGNGGNYGGGGGGGGAASDTSGNGGNGAGGIIIVTTYF